MNSARVNPNISYASVVSGNYNKIYTFQSPRKQYFFFPYEIMKYIIKNPKSPEGLIKLNQTCKYFYLKQRILVVAGEFMMRGVLGQFQFKNSLKDLRIFMKVKTPNLWLHDDIAIHKEFLIDFKRVYRSTIKCLVIFEAEITLKELQLLVAEKTIKMFLFSYQGRIIDPVNGKDVPIDVLLKLLPNVQDFRCFNHNENYSKETLKKMIAVKLNNKLKKFMLHLNEVSADFDAILLFEFILKNSGKFCEIVLFTGGGNHLTLLKLIAAEEKIKSLEKWKEQKFDISFEEPHE